MIFPVSVLTNAKQPTFSTNHLADINKTKHKLQPRTTTPKPKQPSRKTTNINMHKQKQIKPKPSARKWIPPILQFPDHA